MTNYDLYLKFIEYKKKNKITYSYLADELKSSKSVVFDKVKRLQKGQSVYTEFLLELERVLGARIFFN